MSASPPGRAEAKASAAFQASHRHSQLMKDGLLLRASFQEAARRRQAGADREADQILIAERQSLDDQFAEEGLGNYEPSRAAKEIEDVLFRLGRMDRIESTLNNVLSRPAVREVLRGARSESSDHGGDKLAELGDLMLKNLNAFFTRHNLEKGGSRTLAEQRAVDTVLKAVVSEEVFEGRLGRTMMGQLNVTHTALHRALELKRLEVDTSDMFFYQPRSRYINAMPRHVGLMVSKWLHDHGSTPDNTNKGFTKVFTKINAEGQSEYEEHTNAMLDHSVSALHKNFLKSDAMTQIVALSPVRDGKVYTTKVSEKEFWKLRG